MKKIILFNAITWAALILFSAYFFKDDPNYFFFFGILLVGFTFINSLLAKYENKDERANCSR